MCIAGCSDDSPSDPIDAATPDAAPNPVSAEIVYPDEVVSAGGVLQAEIRVAYATNNLIERDVVTGEVTSREIYTRTYNGSIPGPTLRLAAGERMEINLINDLPPNPDEDQPITEVNFPHHTNSTNFHTHGLHVEPTGDGDNVLREIKPETTALVSIDIPQNHNPGLFWYHGHKHGANMAQFLSGMWGAIIIEGDVDQVPEVAAAAEKIMVFGELGVDENGLVPEANADAIGPGDVYIKERIFAINGIVRPIIRMRPGEVQRWRMIDAATECTMDLTIEGHQFHHLAFDGVTLDAVQTADVTDITSGQRADFLIRGGEPGEYRIYAPNSLCDGDQPAALLEVATLVVEGEPMQMDLPTDLPAPDYILPDTRQEVPDRYETSEFAVLPPQDYLLQRTIIDGKSFDANCIDKIFQRGELIEWTLTNISPVGHPFHIHTNSFQVLEVNDVPLDPPVWRDVVLIPPTGDPNNPGKVLIRTRIDDFIGGLVLHCHIITHEDLGMMQNVVIVDDTIPPQDVVTPADIQDLLDDPATHNPDVPGYYVSENFTACTPAP